MKIKTSNNKKILKQSKTCACYKCLETFRYEEIKDYTSDDTAKCPHCGSDSVLGDNQTIEDFDLSVCKMHVHFWCWGCRAKDLKRVWNPTTLYKKYISGKYDLIKFRYKD